MGKRILIMGGKKAVSIGLYPILQWYHDEFRKMLTRRSARLMVIGYSFSPAVNPSTMAPLIWLSRKL